jgi:alkane 1-monooxygenase
MSQKPVPIPAFAIATLAPVVLIIAGVWQAGVLAAAAFVYMSLFVLLADQMLPRMLANVDNGAEFPASDALLVAIGTAHVMLLPLCTFAIAGDSGLGPAARLALFLGAGLWFGQVANPAAHELIHRGNRWLFRLGALIFASLLFGHHTSSHRLVHHMHAASPQDPNSAKADESFYRFFVRAWVGSFRQGFAAEARLGRRPHPYVWYLAGALAALASGYLLAGWRGVAVWAGLALHAQVQLLLSDYVQHYGLRRRRNGDGLLEPVGPAHSWNAPHQFSAALMLNAARHSDHHAHPGRPYPALRLPAADQAPRLPWPLPLACTIALVPPLWRHLMRPHLARWPAAG